MTTATAYDVHVEQLFDVLNRVTSAFREAGIEYRVIGGVAVFLHVWEKDSSAARVTRDIDLAVERRDLGRIAHAARPFGFEYRHSAWLNMLVDEVKPGARSAVHLMLVREQVRPEISEAIPDFTPPAITGEGVLLAPVADLVRMKLGLYRMKDRVHIQDMDSAGLITPEVEAGLSPEMRRRLIEIRWLR